MTARAVNANAVRAVTAGTVTAGTVTAGTVTAAADLQQRLLAVPRPAPVLPRDRERALTARQQEILDRLSDRFDEGFVDLTMAEIAAWLNCSLRTLYGVAPSRDELVLVVVDRNLWRIGRTARAAIEDGMRPLTAVRAYLRGATVAVGRMTPAFARDLAQVPAAERLRDAHEAYLVAITRCLLDLAVEEDQIGDIDTAAFARVMAGVAGDLARPGVIDGLRTSPKDAADAVIDTLLCGLTESQIARPSRSASSPTAMAHPAAAHHPAEPTSTDDTGRTGRMDRMDRMVRTGRVVRTGRTVRTDDTKHTKHKEP